MAERTPESLRPNAPHGIVNPGYEADMLRRCATACRNFTGQALGDKDWFGWVAPHLDQAADRLQATPSPAEIAALLREGGWDGDDVVAGIRGLIAYAELMRRGHEERVRG